MCLLIAYATNRTLVLDLSSSRIWQDTWESVFQPVGPCTDLPPSPQKWSAGPDAPAIKIIDIELLRPRSSLESVSVPADLVPRLRALGSDPAAWWVGQLVGYIMRPSQAFKDDLEAKAMRISFPTPGEGGDTGVVGLHVRRTDKVGTEAAYHDLDEYMDHVEDYFLMLNSQRHHSVSKRLVYLATDEPSLHKELTERYPGYRLLGDVNISSSAKVTKRNSVDSLKGFLIDIHFLSRCDFLVCTFSSQVCRLAYELMQTLRTDAHARFHSLDDAYYFSGFQL